MGLFQYSPGRVASAPGVSLCLRWKPTMFGCWNIVGRWAAGAGLGAVVGWAKLGGGLGRVRLSAGGISGRAGWGSRGTEVRRGLVGNRRLLLA